jgi:hypothetical protein
MMGGGEVLLDMVKRNKRLSKFPEINEIMAKKQEIQVMRNPFWRFKTIPWITLLQAAGLVVAIATVADILLGMGLGLILSGPIGRLGPFLEVVLIILPLAAGYGIGALAIFVMEKLFRNVYLDTAVLWALVPCIALVVFLKASILPIPTFLVQVDYSLIVGVILGIFVTGKRYW